MQLWQGRFTKAVDSRVNDFNSSIRFDRRMAAQDITGSMAHAAMLSRRALRASWRTWRAGPLPSTPPPRTSTPSWRAS